MLKEDQNLEDESTFVSYRTPPGANIFGKALVAKLNKHGIDVALAVARAGITTRVHAQRWLTNGVPPKYVTAMARALQCDEDELAPKPLTRTRKQQWQRAKEGSVFQSVIEGLTPHQIAGLLKELQGDATILLDGYLRGISSYEARRLGNHLGVSLDEATREQPVTLPEGRSAAGLVLSCAMQESSTSTLSIAQATGAGRQSVRAWMRDGVPKKHCNLVAGLLKTHPLFLCPSLHQGKVDSWIYGWHFSEMMIRSYQNPQEAAQAFGTDAAEVIAWCRSGVPRANSRTVSELLKCRQDQIRQHGITDKMPVAANEAASKLQQMVVESGMTVAEISQAIGVTRERVMAWLAEGVPSSKSLAISIVIGALPSEIQRPRERSKATPQGMAFTDACAKNVIGENGAYLRLGVGVGAFKLWRIKGVPKSRALFVANTLSCHVDDIAERE